MGDWSYHHCIAQLALGNFHYLTTSHLMLGIANHFDSNIQNNTSIKSQATVPQETTAPIIIIIIIIIITIIIALI